MLDGSGQRLQGRLLGHADLAEATRLVPQALPLGPEVRAALPAIWTRLLGQPGFNADVIEDLARPAGQRLVGMGMAIALDARWQQRLAHDPPAFAPALIYRELHERRFQPPDDRALARSNARGEVSFLVLHYQQALTDLANPDTLEMLGVAMTLFRSAHAGFRLRALYQEGLGEEGAYLASMGFQALAPRGRSDVPDLYGLTRAQARRLLPGTPVRDAFQFTPPRLGFSLAERKLLRLAVSQLTDEQASEELGLSAHTVKKLWRSVFQRTADAMPALFGDSPGGEEGTRGPEKRRSLLRYLQQRPEELRPWCAATYRTQADQALLAA